MTSTPTNSGNKEVDSNKTFQFFARHLVGLGGVYYPLDEQGRQAGPAKIFVYSGWILSVRDHWCMVTSGHAIKDTNKLVREGQVQITEWFLMDGFGPDVKHAKPIPLAYDRLIKLPIEDESAGLDFTLIVLSQYYELLLQANGIVAVDRDNWIHQHEIQFERYLLLGIPTKEAAKAAVIRDGSQLAIDMNIQPYALLVERVDNPPASVEKTALPRFVGRVSEACTEEIMDGMSGGPIFGFAHDKYWIVAIQSRWIEQSKTILGCPVPVFARLIEELLDQSDGEST